MTDELQTELDGDQDAGTGQESGAELATAAEGEQQKTNDGMKDGQEWANKAIHKQHAKYREEERKRIALENEAAELKAKLEKYEVEKGNVEIPPIPDSFDDDFDEKIAAREEAIRQKAIQDARQQTLQEQQKATREAAQKAEQDRFQGVVESYQQKVIQSGLNQAELMQAEQTIVDYGVSGEVAEHIMNQDDAPFITKYLADNPLVLDELRNMTPINAALKINSTIQEAASKLKPSASSAPDPVETLSGRGAGEKVSPLIEGASFE